MSKTGRLGLPYILQGQAQKEVTHNQALNRLDVFVNTVAEDIVDELSTEANDGDIYIVRDKLAQYSSGSWTFYSPSDLMEVMLKSTRVKLIYDGDAWIPLGSIITDTPEESAKNTDTSAPLSLITKDTGEYLRVGHFQEDIKLLGKVVSTQNMLPDHSLVIAVNIRVLEEITGTPSFAIGVKEDPSRYGDKLRSSKDTTNIGMTYHPITYYYDTPITITPNQMEFTEGVIRVTAQYLKTRGPWIW